MEVSFTLPCKAFSINAYWYGDRRHKTKEAREWEELIGHHLDEEKSLTDLADTFKEQGGQFHIKLSCIYPHYIFYNKAGEISSKTFDVTNTEKPLIDLIFARMSLNDKFVTKLISEKRPGATWAIEIKIELLPAPR